jgi:hypothetical protein
MTMRVTASKVGLLAYCLAFAREDYEWDATSSSRAERGTRFHKAASDYVETRERVEVEEDIREEYAAACDWIDSLQIPTGGVLIVERAFAWDPIADTAECIGRDRDYSRAGNRLCGTADLVMLVTIDGTPIAAMVWDWKTGDGTGAGPQLRTLGLMVSRAYKVPQVTVAALEARRGVVFEVAREDLDAFTLDAIAGELAEQLSQIATAEPQPGSHCGELYCPARLSCPLGNAAAAQLVDVIPPDQLVRRQEFRLTDPITTPEHAAWAVDVIRLVGAKLEAIKDSIKAMVPPEGWKLEDGRILREGRCQKSTVDKHKALALCKQLGATEAQIASLTYTFETSSGLRVVGGGTKPRTKRTKAA